MRNRIILFFFVLLIGNISATCTVAQGNTERINELEAELKKTTDPRKHLDLKIEIAEMKFNMDLEFWKSLSAEAHALLYENAEAKCLNNVGYILISEGKQAEALEYYHRSLDLYRKTGSKQGMAGAYNDIGGIYSDIHEEKKAMEYYQKSHALFLEMKDSLGISLAAHNISSQYLNTGDLEKAKVFALKSLEIARTIQDKQGIPSILQNLGSILEMEKNTDSALVLYKQGNEISKEIGLIHGVAYTSISIGEIYLKKHRENNVLQSYLDSAENYFMNSWQIGIEINNPDIRKRASQRLMRLYSYTKNWKQAYYYADIFYALKDTLDNADKQKDILRNQMQYEHDLDKKITDEKTRADKALSEEKAKRQFSLIIAAGIVIALLILFAVFIIRKWKQTQQQKIIIERQKELVEEKQKEITDSINYAQRIQYSLLAQDELLKRNLPEYFVLFRPKDIVSGDFYWATEKVEGSRLKVEGSETENNPATFIPSTFNLEPSTFYLAVCDSTGHGVPGAFMSLLNISFLNEAINEKNITEPHKVLNFVRDRLIQSMESAKDGMDATLIRFEKDKITYASANHKPLLIRNKEIIELGADHFPVGKSETQQSFTLYETEIKKGDSLFFYTDGFADQFGGSKGKKFKYSNLKKLLAEIAELPVQIQSKKLQDEFEKWKGDLEQVDDICITGIRI